MSNPEERAKRRVKDPVNPGRKKTNARERDHRVKLTRELIDRICNYIRAGAYVETAALSAGVDKTTFYRWLKDSHKPGKGICKELRHALDKAVSDGELRDLMAIDKGSQGRQGEPLLDRSGQPILTAFGKPLIVGEMKPDWRAAAWKLERRHPKRWGPKSSMEVTGADGGPIETAELTPEERKARIDTLLKERKDLDGESVE